MGKLKKTSMIRLQAGQAKRSSGADKRNIKSNKDRQKKIINKKSYIDSL